MFSMVGGVWQGDFARPGLRQMAYNTHSIKLHVPNSLFYSLSISRESGKQHQENPLYLLPRELLMTTKSLLEDI